MGLIKQVITHIILQKAEDALVGETAVSPREDRKQARKAPLFKSRYELAEATAAYFFSVHSTYIMFSLLFQIDYISWDLFYRTCAMASLVAWSVFLVGILIYGLYRADLLPLLFMFVPGVLVFIFAVIPLGFEYGYGIYKDFFLGVWMHSNVKLIFFLLAIITTVVTLAFVIHYENGGTQKKPKKRNPPPISDEEVENNRNMLRMAIQNNAINIRFLKRKWNFTTVSDVLFGYDEQNKQLVFVNNQNSHVLSCKKVVYLDFEDILGNPDASVNTSEYQRIIKLHYLESSKKESVLTLVQIYSIDEGINRIKYYANNNPAGNSEIVFRRKIRHLASTLERDFYPCRPFANDGWFDLLKESMEKIKNNNTDGYSLFRDKVIAAEDYMDDETLFSIICDLSVDPPDKASAKKEAKRLCLNDFGATLRNDIKSSVRNIFSNGK